MLGQAACQWRGLHVGTRQLARGGVWTLQVGPCPPRRDLHVGTGGMPVNGPARGGLGRGAGRFSPAGKGGRAWGPLGQVSALRQGRANACVPWLCCSCPAAAHALRLVLWGC
jgi:hypothetical protein